MEEENDSKILDRNSSNNQNQLRQRVALQTQNSTSTQQDQNENPNSNGRNAYDSNNSGYNTIKSLASLSRSMQQDELRSSTTDAKWDNSGCFDRAPIDILPEPNPYQQTPSANPTNQVNQVTSEENFAPSSKENNPNQDTLEDALFQDGQEQPPVQDQKPLQDGPEQKPLEFVEEEKPNQEIQEGKSTSPQDTPEEKHKIPHLKNCDHNVVVIPNPCWQYVIVYWWFLRLYFLLLFSLNLL